jgi:hypothetical protein
VKNGSPVSSLVKYTQYRGVSLTRYPDAVNKACKSDTVSILYFNQRSVSGDTVQFNILRKYIEVGSKPEACEELSISNQTVIGTVKFYTDVREQNQLCSVNLWADFQMTDPKDPTWKGAFASRAVVLEDGSFVIGQPGPTGGSFRTPIAFTGI